MNLFIILIIKLGSDVMTNLIEFRIRTNLEFLTWADVPPGNKCVSSHINRTAMAYWISVNEYLFQERCPYSLNNLEYIKKYLGLAWFFWHWEAHGEINVVKQLGILSLDRLWDMCQRVASQVILLPVPALRSCHLHLWGPMQITCVLSCHKFPVWMSNTY